MTLLDAQQAFSQRIAELILWLGDNDYGVTLGEAYRTPEMALIYAQQGKGIMNSNHTLRLAMDLNLFRGTAFLTTVEDYREAGEQWEAMGNSDFKTCWGGRFSVPDADHFSFCYNGVR